MIIFHEGLPGSGKSYEAVIKHVLEALKQGRKVFTNIEGMNHEKTAQITGIPVNIVRFLLIQLTDEQVPEIYKYIEANALIVIDEIQDFFPSSRDPLPAAMTTFVTRHRHDGLDIIIMGQDFRDCHSLWKRRTAQKVTFMKQDAVGLENNYIWTLYKARTPEKFEKITSGSGKYDKQYFGLYASHTSDETNKINYKDKRALLWNNSYFKLWLPLAFGVGVYAVYVLVNFFSGAHLRQASPAPDVTLTEPATVITFADEEPIAMQEMRKQIIESSKLPLPENEPPTIAQEEQTQVEPAYDPVDYLDELIQKYKPRLSGFISSETDKNRFDGYIELLDGSFHQKEVLTITQVQAMGWTVEPTEYGVLIKKASAEYVVTAWPIDQFGKVNQYVYQSGALLGTK